jgi:hypothetical protein
LRLKFTPITASHLIEPMATQEDVVQNTDEYHAADTEYRQSLLNYALTAFSAEVAALGFLLQTDVTRKALVGDHTKYVYALALGFTFLTVIPLILYKRFDSMYREKTMHASQYRMFKENPHMLPNLGTAQELTEKERLARLESFRYAYRLPKMVLLAELFLCAGLFLLLISVVNVLFTKY